MGGVPPPLVFDFGRFVVRKRSFEGLPGEVGSCFQVVGKAWDLERIWEVLWSGLGLPLGILVGFWEALGLSWAALGLSWAAFGLLLGRLGRSWEALGLSWAVLGGSWAILGSLGQLLCALGQLWSDLGRQVGAK